MDIKEKIKSLAEEYHPEIVKIRRHIHQNPELSFEEFNTSEFIAKQLKNIKIDFKKGFVKTGIVGHIYGKNPDKKVIALRADMDALPIIEENDISYKSNNNAMHACGHDVHTASLIGVAKILNELKDQFEGTVKLIFQPGEELIPGGALLMMQEGALSNPEPEIVIGQHTYPGLPAGKIGMKPGNYMASSDEIYLTVKGKGGHAAIPEDVIDTVLIASKIIVKLKDQISTKSFTTTPTILSFGKVIAKGATNVIPNEVKIEGTFRTFHEGWRKEAHSKITSLAKLIAKDMGGTCEVNIKNGYPHLINDDSQTTKAFEIGKEFLGEKNVKNLKQRLTAEDFAYFSHKYPSVFYRLGISNEQKGITSQLHTSTFNVDEESLKTGMGFMAYLAIKMLEE
jgi:amidohydrolase